MTYKYFRVFIFVAHFITAIFMLATAFHSTCKDLVTVAHTAVPAMDILPAWPVAVRNPQTCPPHTLGKSVGGLNTVGMDWCGVAMPIQPMDEQNDVRTLVPGGAWNVLILIVMFEWITASFALLYLEEPAILWQNIPMPPGVHPLPALATMWNIVLLILLWLYHTQLLLPDNNLVMFTFILLFTIIIQNYVAGPQDSGGINTSSSSTVSASVVNPAEMGGAPFEWRTDTFLRRRPKPSSTSLQSIRYELITPLGVMANFPQLHSLNYSSELDPSGHSVSARFLEYSCTAPLLVVGLYLNFDGHALTWVYQTLFISLMATNLAGLTLHQSVLALRTCSSADRLRLQTAGILALVASWLAFSAGFAVYIFNARVPLFHTATGIPDWVVSLLWLCIVGYAAFGIIITVLYSPRLWNPEGTQQETWTSTFDWATLGLDTLSFVVKFVVAWIIYAKGSIINCSADFPSC